MSPASFPPAPVGPAFLHRLLCVDDDRASQRLLMASLARPGFTVECVCDGQEALERFADKAHAFDVLVTDHWMPRLDGLGLVRRLRGAGFVGGIVVVSAAVTPEAELAYRDFGVAVILRKPVGTDVLRTAVDCTANLTFRLPLPHPACHA